MRKSAPRAEHERNMNQYKQDINRIKADIRAIDSIADPLGVLSVYVDRPEHEKAPA